MQLDSGQFLQPFEECAQRAKLKIKLYTMNRETI